MCRLFYIILLFPIILQAQTTEKEKAVEPAALFIDIAYSFQLPEGDLKNDFGFNSNVGARIGYLLPNNWLFAVGGEWLFSDQVKTDVLAPLRESSGSLIDFTGQMALTQLGERGFMVNGQVGRLFPLIKKSRKHCIETRFGIGYIQHWVRIRILGTVDNLPQLSGGYLRGYDRRTSGIALQQYVGYKYMSNNRLINLFIGFDMTEGFTKNRRVWNFDTRMADLRLHKDILLGIRAGFTIPFFIYNEHTRLDDLDFY